jgi:hypothetical protein
VALGSACYDFETVAIHELGHGVGFANSADTDVVMYATLATSVSAPRGCVWPLVRRRI